MRDKWQWGWAKIGHRLVAVILCSWMCDFAAAVPPQRRSPVHSVPLGPILETAVSHHYHQTGLYFTRAFTSFFFFFKFIQDTKYFWPLIPVCVQQKVHFHDDICSVGHGLSSHRFDVKPHSCVTGTNHTQTAKKPFGVIKRKHTVTQCETCFGPNYQNYQRVGFRFQLLN